jgi:hypothetical protein
MPAGASFTPGSRTRPDTEKVRRPLRPLRPWPENQSGTVLDDVAHPEQGLDVVDERRAAEEADLARERGLVARQAALALDRFEHRGFLAADIGARAAAQMDLGVAREPRFLQLGDLAQQDLAHLRVLVAQVDVDRLRLDRERADQHALEETVRVLLEIVPVLEGAGLALVGVDRHEARCGLGAHEAPLAACREAGAAEAAQVRILQRLDNVVDRAGPAENVGEQTVAASFAVPVEIDVVRNVGMNVAVGDVALHAFHGSVLVQRVADRHHGGAVAAAHAGRAHDAHGAAQVGLECGKQRLGASERAAQRVADAHGEERGRLLAVHDNVEMGVEGSDLVDLHESEPHVLGERREVARVQAAVMVLDEVQEFDQEIGPAWTVAKQCPDLVERGLVDLPPPWGVAGLPTAGARVDAAVGAPLVAVRTRIMDVHGNLGALEGTPPSRIEGGAQAEASTLKPFWNRSRPPCQCLRASDHWQACLRHNPEPQPYAHARPLW